MSEQTHIDTAAALGISLSQQQQGCQAGTLRKEFGANDYDLELVRRL